MSALEQPLSTNQDFMYAAAGPPPFSPPLLGGGGWGGGGGDQCSNPGWALTHHGLDAKLRQIKNQRTNFTLPTVMGR